jgi:hypothetical protein
MRRKRKSQYMVYQLVFSLFTPEAGIDYTVYSISVGHEHTLRNQALKLWLAIAKKAWASLVIWILFLKNVGLPRLEWHVTVWPAQ